MQERIRVCVVDSAAFGPAYPRLAECPDLEVVGQLPWLDPSFLTRGLLGGCDLVLVGAGASDLHTQDFRAALMPLARAHRVVLVPADTVDMESIASCGVRGLVGRDIEPAAFVRVARAVCDGELAFPRSSVGDLLRVASHRSAMWRANLAARRGLGSLTNTQNVRVS